MCFFSNIISSAPCSTEATYNIVGHNNEDGNCFANPSFSRTAGGNTSTGTGSGTGTGSSNIEVQSAAIMNGNFTSQGFPAISWTAHPDAESYVVVIYDNDASYMHYLSYNIPNSISSITDGAAAISPAITAQPFQNFNPPAGTSHRYTIAVYALNVPELQSADNPMYFWQPIRCVNGQAQHGVASNPPALNNLVDKVIKCSTIDGNYPGTGAGPGTLMTVTSSAITSGNIDQSYGCGGVNADKSPEISWSNAPDGTVSFIVSIYDNDFEGMHWGVYNLNSTTALIPEGTGTDEDVPSTRPFNFNGGIELLNDIDVGDDYYPFCPGSATTHTYSFTVFAINSTLDSDTAYSIITDGCNSNNQVDNYPSVIQCVSINGDYTGL